VNSALAPQPDDLFGLVFEAAPSGMLLVNQTGLIVLVNTQVERLFDYSRQELLGQPIDTLIPERFRRQHPDHLRTFFTSPSVRAMGQGRDLYGRRKDGTEFPVEIGLNPVPLPHGFHVLTSIVDMTERKQSAVALQRAHDELEHRVHERTAQIREVQAALQQKLAEHTRTEQSLHETHQLLQSVIQTAPIRIFWKDRHSRYLGCNQQFANDAGLASPQQLIGKDDSQLVWHAQATLYQADDRHIMDSGVPKLSFEEPQTTPDGRQIWLRTSKVPLRNSAREIIGILGVYSDITAQKQAELATREALATLDSTADGIFIFDPQTLQFSYVNEGAAQQTGYSREELLRMTPLNLKPDFDEPGFRTMMAPLISNQLRIQTFTTIHRKKNGADLPVEVNLQYFGSGTAQPRLIAIVRDITERKQGEAALRDSEERLRLAMETARMGAWDWNVAANHATYSHTLGPLFGLPPGAQHATLDEFLLAIHPEDRARVGQALTQSLESDVLYCEEYRTVWPDNTVHWLSDRGQIYRDQSGRPVRMIGVITDITDRKLAEASLKRTEEQLQQMQKLEAVGRLAGGVAHDFNNLLTGINGNVELLLKQVEPWSPLYQRLETVRTTGQKAAKITKQLLTLGRQHIAQPERLNLNGVIENMADILPQILGENIRLTLALAPTLGIISADPGQLDQILLNLATNARDAMPSGGTLAIETTNVSSPSPAVQLVVRDTGQGMSPDVQAHIFEPFFTTKEFGKGTGLGLATVYGIMAQSGGTIGAISALGKGTTFTLTFPRVDTEAVRIVEQPDFPKAATQTILLVDDDIIVREIAREMLTMQGYQVLEAPNGQEALQQMAAAASPIHLLVTDIMMPGMNGRELAEQLLAKQPTLRVVFMSGYNEDELLRKGISSQSVTFVAKPFTINSLSSAVKAVLDGHNNP
jgi:two-component system cell cycle sensor histidine kinase/response regulator CckA